MADSLQQSDLYLGEDASSVSQGATAVPVFIGDLGTAVSGVVAVDSWAAFTKAAEDGAAAGAAGAVLRGYFENGGGRAYLANTVRKSLKETLAAVEAFKDVTILVPLGLWDQGAGAAGETARAVAAYAAGHQAMAILHADRDHNAKQAGDAAKAFKLDADQPAHSTLYHPWLVPAGDQAQSVPPVGAVAGVWATVDRKQGVWKAPTEVGVKGVAGPVQKVTDDEQKAHGEVVNFVRDVAGGGTRVWGARTLDGADPTWRYITVRRLADAVERDLRRYLQFVAFEPNTQPTWSRVQSAADTYLKDLWGQGGLAGDKSSEAYLVQVGRGTTMTDEDIDAGWVILKVGLAVLSPGEFITVTVKAEALAS
ncbi:phage tail sheath C-terminal domain-containing protein [Streptomyces sp. ADI98-10]|uniref:phage tail sheath family protein n=1 Tax=Streptomyces sp. ADI98-10 TaxID=1522763 RepID=UPI000F969C8C|nr:phage tail sheath C-terminal domain-containing protein [Streptomyces sp. ADI98-10]RPK78317.1 Phage tail sheath protein [Streptomyces sp. ADI98-10]